MKKRVLMPWLLAGTAAIAMAAALKAPAEVLKDLDFFRDLEMIMNMELLEDEKSGLWGVTVSTRAAAAPDMLPAVSTAAPSVRFSTAAVNVSTSARRDYEKN